MATSEATRVRTAKFRAAVLAKLLQAKAFMPARALYDSCVPAEDQETYSRDNFLHLLMTMVDNNQIKLEKSGRWSSFGVAGDKPQLGKMLLPADLGQNKSSKDVELNFKGITLVIGYNAATGRPRITIE